MFQLATPRVRHVLFWHYVTSGREWRQAPTSARMYAATKEHFSDRKLKKATDANYVRHRAAPINTITRKNFSRVPSSPTLLLASKKQVAVALAVTTGISRDDEDVR